jgi:hypothetical protein
MDQKPKTCYHRRNHCLEKSHAVKLIVRMRTFLLIAIKDCQVIQKVSKA